MAIHNENPFEREICEHLAAHGWLYSKTDHDAVAEYDRKRAIIPADVFAWLEATQPEKLAKAVKPETAERDREALLDRLEEFEDIEDLKAIRHEPTRPFAELLAELGLDGPV